MPNIESQRKQNETASRPAPYDSIQMSTTLNNGRPNAVIDIDSARTDLTETYLQMNFRNENFITIENLSYFLRKCLIFRIENCSFVLNYWHYRKLTPDLNQQI